MKGPWVVLVAGLLVAGCNGKKDNGEEDATDVVEEELDVEEEVDADVDEEDGPCTRDGDCDDSDPCTDDTCDTDTGECSYSLVDEDEDGYFAAEVDGTECDGGDDCNDLRDDVHPGATEECDTIDQNCDGSVLDASDADDDSDGHLDEFCGGDDCNDSDDEVYAGAPEICADGVDQDCDFLIDEPTGTLADVRITNDTHDSEECSIAWTGSEFGVAWQENRDGNEEIYFARVSDAGSKVGGDVRVTDAAGASYLPTVIWTGTEYALCWTDEREGSRDVYFTRLSGDGTEVGSDVRVTTDGHSSRRSVIAWSGSEYGLTWSDERNGNWEVYFARLGTDGTKIGSDVRVTDDLGTSYVSDIIWASSVYGLAFHDDRHESYEIIFARVDGDGAKIGPDVRISVTTDASAWVASLTWTGSEYGIAWHDNSEENYEIFFARLNETGASIGPDVRITNISGSSYDADLEWTGSEFVIAWHDDMSGDSEIYVARVSDTGTKLSSDLRLTNEYDLSADASLVWTGSRFGLAWTDERTDNPEIFFNLLDYCD